MQYTDVRIFLTVCGPFPRSFPALRIADKADMDGLNHGKWSRYQRAVQVMELELGDTFATTAIHATTGMAPPFTSSPSIILALDLAHDAWLPPSNAPNCPRLGPSPSAGRAQG